MLAFAFALALVLPFAAAQDTPALPHRAEVIPGVLYVTVYAHDIPNGDNKVPCWSFVSQGFERAGQPEIMFTLRTFTARNGRTIRRICSDYTARS